MKERIARIRQIFAKAIEIRTPVDRDEYLDQECSDDIELREQIVELIKAHDAAGSFIGREDQTRQPSPTRSTKDAKGQTSGQIVFGRGTIISQYKLLQQIGTGGMGAVWMAEQEEPVRRRVALKLILGDIGNQDTIARFEAERQALAMMEHPNIARVFDAGTTEGGTPWFVMELVKGISITKYCNENKLGIRRRLELMVPVCRAVQHAHHKGIVHRDLKPSNVLVTLYDGHPVPKIIDFGLAKALAHQVRLTDKTLFTEFGKVVGTLQYMSPEQAELNALDVDTRTDIYSLGVLIYELLTGTTPIEKSTIGQRAVLQILAMIKESEPPRPSIRISQSGDAIAGISSQRSLSPLKLKEMVNGELDWIVMRALEKDRTRRYESSNQLANDIDSYLKGESIVAAPPSRSYQLQKFVRRNKGVVAAACGITGALGLGLFGTSWGLIHAQRNANLAIQSRDLEVNARHAAEAESYVASIGLALTAMSNENWLEARSRLEACPRELRGWEWSLLKKQAHAVIAKLPSGDDADQLRYPLANQVHDRIACFLDSKNVQFFDFSGQRVSSPMSHATTILDIKFISESDQLVTICIDGSVRWWDLNGNLINTVMCENFSTRFNISHEIVFADRQNVVATDNYSIIFALANSKIVSSIAPFNQVAWSRQLEQLIASDAKGVVNAYDKNGSLIWRKPNETNQRATMKFSDSGKAYIRTTYNGKVFENWLYSAKKGSLIKKLSDDLEFEWLSGSEYFVGFSENNEVYLSNIEAGEFKTIDFCDGTPHSSRPLVRQRGKTIAVGSIANREPEISVWENSGTKLVHRFPILSDVSYYNRVFEISDDENLVWGEFGSGYSFDFRTLDDARLNWLPVGSLKRWKDRNIQKPVKTDQNTPISFERDSMLIWNSRGVVIGEIGGAIADSGEFTSKENKTLIGQTLFEGRILDNGISTVPSGNYRDIWLDAMIESFGGPDYESKNFNVNSKSYVVEVTETTGLQKIFTTNTALSIPAPVICIDRHDRLVIGDDSILRFFDTNSWREVAAIHLSNQIADLASTADGNCLIVKFKGGEVTVFDCLPSHSKIKFWNDCFRPSHEAQPYTKKLFAEKSSFAKILETIRESDLSTNSKLASLHHYNLFFEKVNNTVEWLVHDIETEKDPSKKQNLIEQLERREIANLELNTNLYDTLVNDWVEKRFSKAMTVNNHLWYLVAEPSEMVSDGRFVHKLNNRLFEKLLGLVKDEGVILNTVGVAYYRFGKFEDSIEWLQKSLPKNTKSNLPIPGDTAFLAMAHLQLGEIVKAQEYRRLFEEAMEIESNKTDENFGFEIELKTLFENTQKDSKTEFGS